MLRVVSYTTSHVLYTKVGDQRMHHAPPHPVHNNPSQRAPSPPPISSQTSIDTTHNHSPTMPTMPTTTTPLITPRIIIHGGAGNLTRSTIPRDRYTAYETSLSRILSECAALLSQPNSTALTVATHAVSLLENDPLYNSAHGAVFTRAGHNELECSVMVSNGAQKRGVGCTLLRHVKNPILLAKELLLRGGEEGGRAQDHCMYSGEWVEGLAREWGVEMVGEEYFWTRERWEEHRRGLAVEREKGGLSEWEKETYIPLGTCGAVVVDGFGTVCTATSTGGLTNKVPGRIGDTPTLGAGFWAEEWLEGGERAGRQGKMVYQPMGSAMSPIERISRGDLKGVVGDCLPSLASSASSSSIVPDTKTIEKPTQIRHAVGISGTGNGDSFLRLCAARTTAAYSRFSPASLSDSITWMAGPEGELQRSAGDRWGKVHEGVGGIIGIELVGDKADVIWDFNCGGMIRAWTEEDGSQKCRIFRGDSWESGPESWGKF